MFDNFDKLTMAIGITVVIIFIMGMV